MSEQELTNNSNSSKKINLSPLSDTDKLKNINNQIETMDNKTTNILKQNKKIRFEDEINHSEVKKNKSPDTNNTNNMGDFSDTNDTNNTTKSANILEICLSNKIHNIFGYNIHSRTVLLTIVLIIVGLLIFYFMYYKKNNSSDNSNKHDDDYTRMNLT